MTPEQTIEVFYDGDCPLCMREIRFLQRRDKRRRIVFTDIAAPGFDPGSLGLSRDDFMAKIRGRLPSGELIDGVEVFRRLYAAIGLGPIVLLTRIPGISALLDVSYRWFAANRLRLTGRCDEQSCELPARASEAAERSAG